MSYNNIDFSIRNNKRWVQTTLYSTSMVKGSVIMLCGPDTISHLNDAKLIMPTTNNSRLTIIECDKTTYRKNLKDISEFRKINKSYNINANLRRIESVSLGAGDRFVDLDFCKNLKTNIHIVENIFKQMKSHGHKAKNKTLWKHIIVTFSFRHNSIKDSIQMLCDTFGIKDKFIKSSYFPKKSMYTSQQDKAMYIAYRDGMPMVSFSYQWK